MSGTSRRTFLTTSAVGAAATALNTGMSASTAAAEATVAFQPQPGQITPNFQPGPGQKFDLLIKGGEVIDPSQTLRGRRDVAIHNGRIAAVEADIPPERAAQMLAAKNHIVVPGLVDMHSHVFPLASGLGLPADELVPQSATTTYVSAGDAGANNFGGFRHWVIGRYNRKLWIRVGARSVAYPPVC